ncbi:hypothetical protein KQX54_011162 [Cotesia glomerata]|uniref:BEN domain-containing protein n=1 Tax=Cotesia glomerata TaxID=32391 RepID=A0AAV7HCT5_COTGL|nr:hypothetical protein KQX54_011162 [Cotesia glomerata]
MWEGNDGKKKFYFAKIIEFGASVEDLDKISIDEPPLCDRNKPKISKFKSISVEKTLSNKNDSCTDQDFIEDDSNALSSCININKVVNASDQQSSEDDKLINITGDHFIDPPNFNNLPVDQVDFDKPTDYGIDLSSIWNNDYLNNWSTINNRAINNNDRDSSMQFSSGFKKQNSNESSTIFRPWDSSSETTTANTTSPPYWNDVEEEPPSESRVPTIDIPAHDSTDLETIKETVYAGSLATFLKNEVREADLDFIRMLEASINRAYESQQRYDRQSSEILKIPGCYTQPGEHMVEIVAGSKIYFPLSIKNQIEKTCEEENESCDWETLIKLALREVYGNNISNYSAKGIKVKGSHTDKYPPIDSRLYNAIFDWVRDKVGSKKIITTKMFNTTINKYCANKRTNENTHPHSTKQLDQPEFISEENLRFFKKIVQIIEDSYNMQRRETLPERQTYQLSNVYTQPAKTKVQISPNYEIYLPKSIYMYIERRSEIAKNKYDWRILIKEALLEVYGNQLKNYSAKGTRGGSPGINVELYRALYDWASSVTSEVILDGDFTDVINTLTANKKKGKKSK